ncbi:hypothetical protein H2248_002836 [Termitomyces sp. 'cryptogamus']|nr:hypothetical protein H2248_002836 [Termitomyces sp. 'cryptogamus']
MKGLSVGFLVAQLVFRVKGQTWCGKNYMSTSPIVPPGGQFPIPNELNSPLLALRCSPAIRPYLLEDAASGDPSFVSILIDAPVTFYEISKAAPIQLQSELNTLDVAVSVEGITLVQGTVTLNSTKTSLPFSLNSLQPRTSPYNISCSAKYAGQTFEAMGSLSYLPNPPSDIGSVTKMDLRTGALLARPANGKGGSYAPIFPIGFYTQFDGYLAQNLSILAELAAQGFTIVHPVPTFSNLTALDLVLDEMQEAGLYLMYDMRGTYQNNTSVTEQVNRIKSRPNLLLWYTADEPDGTSDPLNATSISSDLITSLDGGDGKGGAGYHPVSLVLNCENYFFTEYASGSDIVMQDTYMIGNNVTYSTVWHTVCTENYGDCGCDNCKGSFEDISTRMDEFRERLFVNGWERSKAVWTVPQAFGNDTYWQRFPTGKEFIVESILGINHGGLGVVSWDDPTTSDIKASASLLAASLSKMTPYIASPNASFHQVTLGRVDVGLWSIDNETLVLATNMNYNITTLLFEDLGLEPSKIVQLLDSGSFIKPDRSALVFESVGSGAFIVTM